MFTRIALLTTVAVFGTTGAVLLAAIVTIALTLACALPLAWVDKTWTRMLGRMANSLLPRRPAAQPEAANS